MTFKEAISWHSGMTPEGLAFEAFRAMVAEFRLSSQAPGDDDDVVARAMLALEYAGAVWRPLILASITMLCAAAMSRNQALEIAAADSLRAMLALGRERLVLDAERRPFQQNEHTARLAAPVIGEVRRGKRGTRCAGIVVRAVRWTEGADEGPQARRLTVEILEEPAGCRIHPEGMRIDTFLEDFELCEGTHDERDRDR